LVRLPANLLLESIRNGRRGKSIQYEDYFANHGILNSLQTDTTPVCCSQPNDLSHDRPGLVSVRKGSNSGFGFTIFPGGSGNTKDLNENHIVIGQVIEGLDVIELVNNLPVVASAKLNYKGIKGGSSFQEGPSRACRYGGKQLYCNENKPLQKLTMYRTGVL
jgi:cyclophilin family peptidyl-prolyl cis-trans isomerase